MRQGLNTRLSRKTESADPLGSVGVWYRSLSSFCPSCCPPPGLLPGVCHPPAPPWDFRAVPQKADVKTRTDFSSKMTSPGTQNECLKSQKNVPTSSREPLGQCFAPTVSIKRLLPCCSQVVICLPFGACHVFDMFHTMPSYCFWHPFGTPFGVHICPPSVTKVIRGPINEVS